MKRVTSDDIKNLCLGQVVTIPSDPGALFTIINLSSVYTEEDIMNPVTLLTVNREGTPCVITVSALALLLVVF